MNRFSSKYSKLNKLFDNLFIGRGFVIEEGPIPFYLKGHLIGIDAQ